MRESLQFIDIQIPERQNVQFFARLDENNSLLLATWIFPVLHIEKPIRSKAQATFPILKLV